MRISLVVIMTGLVWLVAGSVPAAAQAEGGSEESATGYFRDQDTLPGSYRLYLQQPREQSWLWRMGPRQVVLRKASFAADAHEFVADYSPRRLCTDCHKDHTRDMHQSRAGITCVQCHRDKPIAGVFHYYAAMNQIRRHAYVCAKCHEGASPSFASYVVHEPNPLVAGSRDEFPLFFYAVWFMLILAGGVFAIFIPYTALWGVRELVGKFTGGRSDG